MKKKLSLRERMLENLAEFSKGLLIGLSAGFGVGSMIFGFLMGSTGSFKLFSLALFWGMMSLIFGVLYIGIELLSKEEKN